MISTPSEDPSTTTFVARHEIQEALQEGSCGSPRGIMDFFGDEAEANQHFNLRRPNAGFIDHDLSITITPEALLPASSSHPPAPILLLKPRQDCINSLWNHCSNANASTSTQLQK